MEPNGLSGGMFSSMTSSGLLGGENPLQQQQQNLTNPQNSHHLHHPQLVSYAFHQENQIYQQQQSMKHGHPPYSAKKQQSITATLSDEDEPGGGGVTGDDNNNISPKRKVSSSPWQRMKWTDTMVRLLIMAVYYIGDEGGGGSETTDSNGKKKCTGGLLLKKGKWKSVSRAMMEKGFYVSPQQCEDKFNDLNKRYKRVNDILGKGTACRVVENRNLLDTMELAPKVKEEVKKLLNSKHLFFREMCAYHNSCGHGGGSSGNVPQQQVEVGIEVSQAAQQTQQKRGCSHSSENGGVNFGGTGQEGMRMLKVGNGEKNHDDDDDNDDDSDDESEDDSDEDENEPGEGGSRGLHGQEDEDKNDGRSLKKRPRITLGSGLGSRLGSGSFSMPSQLMQQLNSEVNDVFQDGGRSAWEKKHWMRLRIVQLEEHQIKYHSEAFELEKQRLKWARFSSKKERDMERAKLQNERRRLENERMVLLIRQKELELVKLQKLQQRQHRSST